MKLREALAQLAKGNLVVPWEDWTNRLCSIFAITTGTFIGRTSVPAFVVVPPTWGSQVTIASLVKSVEMLGVGATSTGVGIRADDEQLFICSIGASIDLQKLARGNPLQAPVIDLRPKDIP